MIKVDVVIKLLKKEKEAYFDDIFDKTKDQLNLNDSKEEEQKSDLYKSLLETKKVVMIGDTKWGLRENYSVNELERIEKFNMGITEEQTIELDSISV